MKVRILKYVFLDIVRNKMVIAYTLVLAVISWSVFLLDDNVSKGLLSLLNLILLIVPLVTIVFTTTYVYNSAEFIYLLISQPIRRTKIWSSIFLGLSVAFVLSFVLGAGVPLLYYSPGKLGFIMLLVGCLISLVFVALAMLSASLVRDKAKGIGIAIILWLFFALIFDGLVLFILFQFADYPVEKAMVFLTMFSPIDLGRIMILLQMDISAMMGYTGAVFRKFFGTAPGILVTFLLLVAWAAVPFLISLYRFNKKDQ